MRKLLMTILWLTSVSSAFAQYWEAGLMGGITGYSGDLQHSRLEISSMRPAAGLTARYNFSPIWAARAQLLYGGIAGSDATAIREGLRSRNLSFTNQIIELSAQMEWNIMAFNILEGQKHSPYLFAGVGVFYHNPRAQYQGKTYSLRSLGTEGQTLEGGKKYLPVSASFPIGGGVRFAMGYKYVLGFEFGMRPTLTDYLDDVGKFYPNIAVLAEKDPIAAALSFRTPEFYNQQLDYPAQGAARGGKFPLDFYFFSGVTFTMNLASRTQLEYNQTYREFWRSN
jgi:hypothetical protein